MRVKRVRIANVLGLDELEFEPGAVTIVRGANGQGKTSVLEAIKSVIGGGHDATLLRKGAEEGEVTLVLDDDTEIRKRIRPHATDLQVVHPTMGKVSRSASWIKGMTDAISVNPVDLLTAKRPAEALLEALPMAIESEELDEIFVGTALLPPEIGPGDHRLAVLDRARRLLYEERTAKNREVKNLAGHVHELRQSVPPGSHNGAELEAELAAITVAEYDASEERDRLLLEEQTRHAVELRRLQEESTQRTAKIRAEYNEGRQERTGRRAGLTTKLESVQAVRNTLQMIDRTERDHEAARTASDILTARLDQIDALRRQAAEGIPIEGVEIDDGELYVGGIPFERVNKAERVRVAVEVARLRAGRIPLVCVDGLEALDAEHFEAMVAALTRSGLQAIVTQVTDGALQVSEAAPA